MKKFLMVMAFLGALSHARGEEAALPEGFKELVPIYPGATVAFSVKSEEVTQVHLKSDAKAQDIVDFYRRAMKDKGWREGAHMAIHEGVTAAFVRGTLSLGVTALKPAGEKSHVTLCLTKGAGP